MAMPLAPKSFHQEVLKALEAIWDFDLAALVMLGGPRSVSGRPKEMPEEFVEEEEGTGVGQRHREQAI